MKYHGLEPPDWFVEFYSGEEASLLRADVSAWRQWRNWPKCETVDDELETFCRLFVNFPEFRNQVDYRLSSAGDRSRNVRLWPQLGRAGHLSIAVEQLGPGLTIAHGYSSFIYARTIGRNFHFNHLVTVGHDGKTGIPAIGDNVTIRTGAVVVGAIEIGDDAYIGANAVVNFSVPPNMRVSAPRPEMRPRGPARRLWGG